MKKPYSVVIGGINMDICARSLAPLIPRDSNPGAVKVSLGGVGRNIAHNMRLLGLNVHLMTVFGDDMNARHIIDSCQSLGIDTSCSVTVPEARTSTYVFITDHTGEMQLAVSDMGIYEHLKPEHFRKHLPLLNGAAAVVVDTNMPEESILWLSENVSAPIFADPVSTTKGMKLKSSLSHIHTLKPNLIEAELLSGVSISDDHTLELAANTLLDTGLERVFVSMGSRGVYAANKKQSIRLPTLCLNMVNTTGCGDAFMAAIVWAAVHQFSLEDGARCGIAASSIAMESEETINPNMCEAELLKRIEYKE